MWVPLPAPEELKKICPGRAWAYAMKSLTDLTPSDGGTTSATVLKPIWVIPEKSLTALYGRFLCTAAPMANCPDSINTV